MKRFLIKNLQRVDKLIENKRFIDFLTYSFIALYVLAAVVVALNRYWQFQSFYFDFGIVDRAIWLYSKFKPPLVDHIRFFGNQERLILGDHFNPSFMLFAPLYWLTDRREILLIAQTTIIGVSATIAYNFSKKVLKNRLASFALVFGFLGYVGMQNALITDFHDATVAVLPLMLMFWAALQKRWRIFYLSLFLLLGLKEINVTLGIGVGLFLILKDRKLFGQGLLTIIISILWFVLAVFVVMPKLSGVIYSYLPTSERVSTISTLLSPTVKLHTMFYSFLTFLFLPVVNISLLPAILLSFGERFISNEGTRWTLGMHYNATLAVLMFVSSVFVIATIEKRAKAKGLVNFISILLILTILVLHRFILRGPLGLFYNSVFYEQNKSVQYVEGFISNVPKAGSIMTTNDLALRFTHRYEGVYLMRTKYELIDPDYIVLNLTPGQNPNSFYPLSHEDTLKIKETLLIDPNYRVATYNENQYIFSRVGID